MRYYYYIKHGVDTVHVSPIDKKLLNKVNKLIPKRLKKWNKMIDSITVEIKSEYNTAIKKSVIDFVLGESLIARGSSQDVPPNRDELKDMLGKWRYRYEENRMKIKRTLFAINPCLAQILAIWSTTFKELSFVDMEKVREKGKNLNLNF
jgi:dynein heavy chain